MCERCDAERQEFTEQSVRKNILEADLPKLRGLLDRLDSEKVTPEEEEVNRKAGMFGQKRMLRAFLEGTASPEQQLFAIAALQRVARRQAEMQQEAHELLGRISSMMMDPGDEKVGHA